MEKYLKLMADYCSSGFWNSEGCNLHESEVPVHYWLKQMVDDWQALYDAHSLDDDFDVKAFSKQGYALAVKIKQNLPDWDIVYFDEAASFYNKPRSECLKEIVL